MMRLFSFSRRFLRRFLAGLGMVSADAVPGFSGSTVAISLGVYSLLILQLRLLLSMAIPSPWPIWRQKWARVDGPFLLAMMLGYGVGALLVVRLIRWLLQTFSIELFSFFSGLALGGSYLLVRSLSSRALWWVLGLGGLVLGALISTLPLAPPPDAPSLAQFFLLGVVGSVFMLIPGISGSYVLLILGYYQTIITAVSDLWWSELLFFGAGVLLGGACFVLLMARLIQTHQGAVKVTMAGLIVGSLPAILPLEPFQVFYAWLGQSLHPTLGYAMIPVPFDVGLLRGFVLPMALGLGGFLFLLAWVRFLGEKSAASPSA